MNSSVNETIQSMSAAHLLEAAEMILPDIVGADTSAAVPSRIAGLAGLPPEAAAYINQLAEQSAAASPQEVTDVLRTVLRAVCEADRPDREAIARKLTSAGQRQVITGQEMYVIGVLLIAAYIAYRTGGKLSEKEKITIEEQKDGRRKITIDRFSTSLNPLNPLSGLLEKIFKKS